MILARPEKDGQSPTLAVRAKLDGAMLLSGAELASEPLGSGLMPRPFAGTGIHAWARTNAGAYQVVLTVTGRTNLSVSCLPYLMDVEGKV